MLLAWTLSCVVALAGSTVILLLIGTRLHVSSRLLGLVAAIGLAVGAGWLSQTIWHLPSSDVLGAEVLLVALGFLVALARPRWNIAGQMFFAAFVASAISYLGFAIQLTFSSGLSIFGVAASFLLLLLEISALTISGYFTFESLDATTRTKNQRPKPAFDADFFPRVSLQVAAYNEPPDMLIDTIASLEGIDYPNMEIVVVDNNTEDPDVWRPVEEYCAGRPRVHFFHADNVEGFKAGALNLSLREFTDPTAEVVGIVDADYIVDPDYLRETIGYFIDPDLAFVQTPQDYREWHGDPYLTACYDAYKYFFATSMPSRNERNSIIFAGTMGLIRRSALEALQGWDEWCITEDAEASLRLLRAGWSGLYLNRSYGKGIMPLTFSALKSQRFRWCFGGIQILRKHAGELLPWRRTPENRLTFGQRLDYLFGGVQWFTDLLYLGFTAILALSATMLLFTGRVALRPLLGAAILLPATLIASGVLRALWSLRKATGIGMRRSIFAFFNWLSLSWTVALACLQALVRSEGVFLRTPKWRGSRSLGEAVRAARVETVLALFLWGLAVALEVVRHSSIFLALLLVWQGSVYAASLFMSYLNLRSDLPAQLERRRRTESRRERVRRLAPGMVGAGAFLAMGGVAAAVLLGGAVNPGTISRQPFIVPTRSSTDKGVLSTLGGLVPSSGPPVLVPADAGSASPAVVPVLSIKPNGVPTPVASAVETLSPGATPTPLVASPSPSPLASPSAAIKASPSPVVSPSAAVSPAPSVVSPAPSPLPSPAAVSPLPTTTVVP